MLDKLRSRLVHFGPSLLSVPVKLAPFALKRQVLEQVLRRAGATVLDAQAPERARPGLTKADLMAAGLTGGADSARRRQALLKELELPEHTSANALLQVLNGCYSREEALDLLGLKDFDEM